MTLLPLLATITLPAPPCSFPGCGQPAANVIVGAAIPTVATIFLNSVAALSVIFVMVGGARLLLTFGRDEEYGKAVKTILWALGGVIVALTSHRIVTIVITEQYTVGADPLFGFFATVVRVMTLLLNVTFLIAIVIGGARMLTARGRDEEVTKGLKAVMYAIAGTVIINVTPYVVKQIISL